MFCTTELQFGIFPNALGKFEAWKNDPKRAYFHAINLWQRAETNDALNDSQNRDLTFELSRNFVNMDTCWKAEDIKEIKA